MRLLVTADLHYNHPRSRDSADDLIDQINRTGGDALLLVGDTGVADGESIEQALSRFTIRGPRLFVPGNHELWTKSGDSSGVFRNHLPQRVRALGWHWLEDDPYIAGDLAIVGSVGWYDYSYAAIDLQIPRRYYEAKISPGAVQRLPEFGKLYQGDETEHATSIVARWNDGKFVSLGESDEAFLAGRLASLGRQLKLLADVRYVVAAIHHVPLAGLLPPRHGAQWDFARAYLGSGAIGSLLGQFQNVKSIFCGHSHWPMETSTGAAKAINIGSGYRSKRLVTIDL